ncbi:MAG: type III secretion system translocon subunit SctE [Comamonas sp.]|uniref:type III secretion system translocon subunit SctE n=1 Tax=Comamonas sp. TaxID=34028 RepID=UPI002FCA7145
MPANGFRGTRATRPGAAGVAHGQRRPHRGAGAMTNSVSRDKFLQPVTPTPDGGACMQERGVQAVSELRAAQFVAPSHNKAGDRIANAQGAPALPIAQTHFSPAEMMLKVQELRLKTQEGQLRTAKEGLHVTHQQISQERSKMLAKREEAIEKGSSAEAKSKVSKILGWSAKIGVFAVSAMSVLALSGVTGLTGGAASPLLALAILGLVASGMSLLSAGVQTAGGPTIDLNAGFNWASKAFLDVMGVPEKDLETASRLMAGALGVVSGAWLVDAQLTGSLASGIVEMAGSSENQAAIIGATVTALASIAVAVVMAVATSGASGPEAVKQILKGIPQIANVVQHGITGVSAAGTAVAAGINVGVAFDQHAADSAQVDRQRISAVIAKLQALMEQDSEQITQLVKDIQESMSMVSKMISQAGQSLSQIAANIGHSMA